MIFIKITLFHMNNDIRMDIWAGGESCKNFTSSLLGYRMGEGGMYNGIKDAEMISCRV